MDTLRVLTVEDEPDMRKAVRRALSRYVVRLPDIEGEIGFSVEEAASAEEGLERITASCPDLLLLDHKLPGMSGVELLSILAERQPDLLTIMVTAYATLETAVSATKKGAFDFLAKPFNPEELKAAVAKAARHLLLQREARRLLLEKRQLRFQFISVLVHELKAPLAAIQGYLYILQGKTAGTDPAVYDRAIDRSLIRVEGMRKLIMDLLDLTRLESGQSQREAVDLDLSAVAQSAIETVLPEAQRRQITVQLEAPGPVAMRADRGEMEILLNNLVTNAVKYNRDSGSVHVRLRLMDGLGKVEIRVADTGIGMSPEECGRLFQEFVRIKNDQTRGIMGSGLGLSIVRRLARGYGGDVSVESEPGVGTTFTVILNAQAPPDAVRAMTLTAGAGGSAAVPPPAVSGGESDLGMGL